MSAAADRELLRRLFDAAVAAVSAAKCLPPRLPAPPKGRTIVVGGGKAGAAMAKAVEDTVAKNGWRGPLSGLVVTRYGHGVPCERIEVVEAAHPVPDAAGRKAAARMLEAVKGLGPDDLVLCLISGGGSALLAAPAEGLTLEDKQAVNRALLKSGANITEMNCVRKHLSAIKGGRLAAAAAPARVVTLAISDVPGDDPSVIASGPTVPDPDHLRRCARRARQVRHRRAARGDRAPARREGRNAEARRSALRAERGDHARHRAGRAARRRRRGARGRRRAGDPRRLDRGRGARRRGGARRHRSPGRALRRALPNRPACCSPAARRR